MRNLAIVASVIVAIAVPAAAATDDSARGIGVYGSFFASKAQNKPPAAPAPSTPKPQQQSKPAIVCGMTLLAPRPVDPGMKHATPTNRQFPMLKLEPQICKR